MTEIPACNSVDLFLRADAARLYQWVLRRQSGLISICLGAIIIGAGMYGAVMGSWRDALQAFYTSIKLPLVILLTTLGNGLINAMLAPLLGLNVGFRQSLLLVLISFALASLILAGLAPIALFLVWNTPPLTSNTDAYGAEHGFLQLNLALFVAFAGTVGNARLLPLLREWCSRASAARNVLLAWLASNLFLGSQICWLLRPFIWDPNRPVEFLGHEYFKGSFFETVFEAARRLLFSS